MKKVWIITALTLTTLAFQNCGQLKTQGQEDSLSINAAAKEGGRQPTPPIPGIGSSEVPLAEYQVVSFIQACGAPQPTGLPCTTTERLLNVPVTVRLYEKNRYQLSGGCELSEVQATLGSIHEEGITVRLAKLATTGAVCMAYFADAKEAKARFENANELIYHGFYRKGEDLLWGSEARGFIKLSKK